MKRYFFVLLCVGVLVADPTFGQTTTPAFVPSVVKDSFHYAFPEARNVEWQMDGVHYKVKFDIGEFPSHHKVWYTESGEWVSHEEKILKGDLPPRVLDSMYVHFSGYKLDDEIEKLTERHRVLYTLELTKDSEEWKVVYDMSGQIVRKTED